MYIYIHVNNAQLSSSLEVIHFKYLYQNKIIICYFNMIIKYQYLCRVGI